MFSPNITARGPGILPFLELTVDLRIFPYNSPESTEEPLTQGSCYSPLPGPAPAHSWCSSNRRPDTRASPIRAILPRCHPVTWRPGALSIPRPPPAKPFLPAGPARAVPSPQAHSCSGVISSHRAGPPQRQAQGHFYAPHETVDSLETGGRPDSPVLPMATQGQQRAVLSEQQVDRGRTKPWCPSPSVSKAASTTTSCRVAPGSSHCLISSPGRYLLGQSRNLRRPRSGLGGRGSAWKPGLGMEAGGPEGSGDLGLGPGIFQAGSQSPRGVATWGPQTGQSCLTEWPLSSGHGGQGTTWAAPSAGRDQLGWGRFPPATSPQTVPGGDPEQVGAGAFDYK